MQRLKTEVEDAGEAYSNFVDSIGNKATLANYKYALVKYMSFRKETSYDALIAKDATQPKLTESYIKEFIMGLRQRNLAQSTIYAYPKALKHFYSMNDLVLNWRKINRFATVREGEQPPSVRPKDRAYTHQEIQRMLEHVTPRMRAMILLLASSGIRIGALPTLRLRNIQRLQEPEDVYQLTIYEGSREQYTTFTTPEAAKALAAYLQSRFDSGEPYAPTSPVFRSDYDPEDQLQTRYQIKSMSLGAIKSNLRVILERANIAPRHKLLEGEQAGRIRKDVMRAHGFRKFANTQMVQADLKGAAKEMLLGHSIGMDDKYYRPTSQQLLDEYLKAVDLLTINDEHRLRRKVKELTIRTSDISVLKAQLDELRDTVLKKS